jgi:hypothetical protein
MSTEVLNSQENKELEYIAISDKKQSEESIQKNDLEKNFIPFTGKWRVKLFLLNNNGQWDDKGIGFIFLANEIQSQGNEGCSDISSPTHMVKKLIMLEENTKEFILNINITEENLEFHFQRGTILTWKKRGISDEDNIAISFQEKEGLNEIIKNIRIINGENDQDDDRFFEEESPFDIFKDVTIDNLSNISREITPDMDEAKISDLVNYLEKTNCELIKKLGDLLINEEKRIEEIKSSFSLYSQETDISINLPLKNGKKIINEINRKRINNMEDGNGKIENNKPVMCNENINYIYDIFKNMILGGNRTMLELLFDDNNYLISFGALEHETQSNRIIPHRKYFKEIVKFKNPLNITDPSLIKKINQNLRLTYLRDTALGRIINENTIKAINLIIQMNHSEIIQYFMDNTDYLKVLFSQMESENIDVKKDAILFLSELISCSKNVVQSRVTFNEVLCENGILPILSKLIGDNSDKNNDGNTNSISELININIVEIFISILSSVPLLIRQYLIHNQDQTMSQLTNLLLFHNNFPIKYEISQIFKTLIDGEGDPSNKTIFFTSTIDKFISYLNKPYSKTNDKSEISSTIQIIIEIFLTWFNNMDFDAQFWLDKFQINKVIIKLLQDDQSKTVNLYAIKLLKIILDTCENYLVIKIISEELCNNLIKLLNENMKKRNIIFSCIMNFLDSVSLTNEYTFHMIMVYCRGFVYENRKYFENIINRLENNPIPKKKLAGFLMRTYTDASLEQITMLRNFEDCKSNDDDEFNYNDSIFSNEEDDDEINEGVAEGLISKTNLNCFSCIENNNEFNKMNFLKRKRKMPKHDEDEFLQYDNKEEDEEEKSNERCYLSSNQDNNNIFNKEEKMKNHKICQIQFKEGEEDDLCGIYLQEDELNE